MNLWWRSSSEMYIQVGRHTSELRNTHTQHQPVCLKSHRLILQHLTSAGCVRTAAIRWLGTDNNEDWSHEEEMEGEEGNKNNHLVQGFRVPTMMKQNAWLPGNSYNSIAEVLTCWPMLLTTWRPLRKHTRTSTWERVAPLNHTRVLFKVKQKDVGLACHTSAATLGSSIQTHYSRWGTGTFFYALHTYSLHGFCCGYHSRSSEHHAWTTANQEKIAWFAWFFWPPRGHQRSCFHWSHRSVILGE